MSAKRQIFKISTLKALLNVENSCVSLVPCTRVLAIYPYFLNDMKGGVLFSLNKMLKTYDPSLNGIVIGYQNVTILWDEDSGKIRMGAFEAELNVRVEFYVFQPRIGNILEGLVNKKSEHHIGCLVHRCFNATILKPDDVTCEDWFCKDYNINDRVLFKVKDLDFTGSVPYIEGDIDEYLFNQCRPDVKNINCVLNSSKVLSNEMKTKVSHELTACSENSSSPTKAKKPKKEKKEKKDKKKKNFNDEEKYLLQMDPSNALQSTKSALDISVNSKMNAAVSDSEIHESARDSDTTALFEGPTTIKTEENIKNEDEVDKGEETEIKKKKKKVKKSKKKDREIAQTQNEDVNTLKKEKCVDGLHDADVKKDDFDTEFSKSKKTKKKKRKKSSSRSEDPKMATEVTSPNEETDNVFYSTQIDPSKKSEKLNITFCSPILPETPSGNKRKKEKDKRQQVLEFNLGLVKKEEIESSTTKDKKSKSLKRKRERGSESEGVSTPKKYKNGNMYDVVYSPSPRKTYVEDKSLFSDSEKSFKMSPSKKEVKVNGDVHDTLEKCDTEKDVHKSTVQSLLNEVRKEVSTRFQSDSEVLNRETCQDGENIKKSKTVKVENKEEKTAKKRKKKEKEKSKVKGNKETSLIQNTSSSLYEKLLQEAMNSINLITDDVSSASSATKVYEGKKQRRKKKTKESVQA